MTRTFEMPQVVMIAGGVGSRLASAHPGVAKCMVPVEGRPFLGYVLDLLASQRVTKLHLCLGRHANQVTRYLAAHGPSGLKITTSVEKSPQGTAGCLANAGRFIDSTFILLLGDTYTPVDLEDLVRRFCASGRAAAMVVFRNFDALVPSNVSIANGIVEKYDKSAGRGVFEYVDYGIAILHRATLAGLPQRRPVDLSVLIEQLASSNQLAALDVSERFYEIGTPESLQAFSTLVLEGNLPRVSYKRGPS